MIVRKNIHINAYFEKSFALPTHESTSNTRPLWCGLGSLRLLLLLLLLLPLGAGLTLTQEIVLFLQETLPFSGCHPTAVRTLAGEEEEEGDAKSNNSHKIKVTEQHCWKQWEVIKVGGDVWKCCIRDGCQTK